MPDLLAGSTVYSNDSPPAEEAIDETDISDISSTTYTAGSPEVGTTFVAPTTGRVEIIVRLVGDTDNSTNRLFLSTEVYEGTSAAGTLVASASDFDSAAFVNIPAAVSQPGYRTVSGLTPGTTYYVRTMHRVSGGAVCDLTQRGVFVKPLT